VYDVIVVGARCAGSPTALLLARQGYRVLLVDRATFPSDTISTHFIRMPGIVQLQRWGLLERVAASNCPPIRKLMTHHGDFALTGTPPRRPDGLASYGPRRTRLDTILVQAAAEAGAEVRTGFTVQDLLLEGDRVVGMRGHTRGGQTVTERARLVIGADGKHSLVARCVQAAPYREVPALACAYYAYWADVPTDCFEMYTLAEQQRVLLVLPTNDAQVMILVGALAEDFPAYRADIAGTFWRGLGLVPGLAERVRAGRQVERFVGTADVANYFRTPCGPGWALVGDAGYHRDPTPAWGIADAFVHAGLLAEAVDAGLSGRQPLDTALAGYHSQRDEGALPGYDATLRVARIPLPSQEELDLRAALRHNQADTDRFFGMFNGSVTSAEFFAPENIARIMGRTVVPA
jgi:flavin-dependent dehydrogenase